MEWSVIKMNWMWEDVRNINIYVHLSCVYFVIYNYLLNVTVNMCKQTVNYVQFCQDNGSSKLLLPAPVPAMLHLPLPGPARAAAEERGAGRWRLHWRDAGQPAPGGGGLQPGPHAAPRPADWPQPNCGLRGDPARPRQGAQHQASQLETPLQSFSAAKWKVHRCVQNQEDQQQQLHHHWQCAGDKRSVLVPVYDAPIQLKAILTRCEAVYGAPWWPVWSPCSVHGSGGMYYVMWWITLL